MRMTLRRRAQRALPETEGPTLVVATYNIHRCVGVDRRYDPARIAAVLSEIDADVIGLQEVDARRLGERNLDQWAYLSEATGMHAIVGANVLDHQGRFGNAILTRWPVLSTRLHDLSVPGLEPRGAIDADIRIGGTLVRVIAAHLGLDPWERNAQITRVLNLIGKHPERPTVFMGDLNEWRGRSPRIRRLEHCFEDCAAPRSFHARMPTLRLDRIFVSSGLALSRYEVVRTQLTRRASDHLPVRATLALA